jgi:hypothetical protein
MAAFWLSFFMVSVWQALLKQRSMQALAVATPILRLDDLCCQVIADNYHGTKNMLEQVLTV